ncbi:MAG: ribonuclease HII [Chitinophagales bacterium]
MVRKQNEAEEISRLKSMLRFETALYEEGVDLIAGVDEAGRGPLAGPVVAAAVIMPPGLMISGTDDSKKLTPQKRYELVPQIKQSALSWAIAQVFPPYLDHINIYQATRQAMLKAISSLSIKPQHLIIDALKLPESGISQTPLIKGDALSLSVACASILAKVERDNIMTNMEQLFPGYGFAKHKGYATKEHIAAIMRLGPSPIHRISFEPIKTIVGGYGDANQGGLF